MIQTTIGLFSGNRRIAQVSQQRAVAMSRLVNVTVKRRRGVITALHVHEVPEDRQRPSRRPGATTVAEDSQTVYRQHIGGQSQRPTLLYQHRTHGEEHQLAYLMLLGESRRGLMGA